MECIKEVKDGILHLKLSGDLIGESNGSELVEWVNDALTEGIVNCILNISNVRYINSSGIGVLITILTKLRDKNGDLYIVQPSDHVNKLFIMAKLQAIFNIAESESEALEKIK